ncbi:MAG: hypothetical protein ABSG43_11680 [Solirubrobacteraceae bacterium]|jgi:hypothetical protein
MATTRDASARPARPLRVTSAGREHDKLQYAFSWNPELAARG